MNTISSDKAGGQESTAIWLDRAAPLEFFKAAPRVWIDRLPRLAVQGISFGLATLVGVVDYWTGLDVSVAFLYLAPIGLGTWFAGRRTGLLLAAASALVWLAADLLLRTHIHPLLVPIWNTLALAIVFGAVAWLLGAIRGQNERLEQTVRQRTESLRAEIDERIHTEQQLRETNANLVATRADLHESFRELEQAHGELRSTQSQLIEAAKMETVGRLAVGVAHEVKNPLMTLSLGVDYFLNRDTDDGDEAVLVQDMKEAVRRATKIINILLDYARPRPLQRVLSNLNTLIEDSLTLVRQQLNKGHVTVRCELAERLPAVRLDRSRIEHVLVNLVSNAQQAMPAGGTLTIRTAASGPIRNGTGGPGFVTVEIEDTGDGIAPEHLEKIFEPFFTTKPTGQGTGLGLSIVRKIMETHGGSIQLHNREAGGIRAVLKFNLNEKEQL